MQSLTSEINSFADTIHHSVGTVKKSKITHAVWQLNKDLDELISELDNDFCGQFPEQQIYRSSPYYDRGKTIAEGIAEQREPAMIGPSESNTERFNEPLPEQEAMSSKAIQLLRKSGTRFLCMYAFLGEPHVYFEQTGDFSNEHWGAFLRALRLKQEWQPPGGSL